MIWSHTARRRTGSAWSNSCCDDREGRLFAADIIGYLFGYGQLMNTRTLALLVDPDASAYELLVFRFDS